MPLFTAPDRGPRCAHGQQQQFEQYQSPVGPRTCRCSSIYDTTVCLLCVYIYTMYIYIERENLKKKTKAQLLYQTKSSRTADSTKTVLHSQHFICTSTKSHPLPGTDPISHQVDRHNVAPATIQLHRIYMCSYTLMLCNLQ